MKNTISIIIPVLNEESSIISFLSHLQQYRKKGHEVILVDGDSSDDTINLAQNYTDQILISNPGRAIQMNFGATHANNEILLFLHSDTFLPDSADNIIINSLSNQSSWGRFNIKLSGDKIIFRIIEFMINIRSKHSKIATGDQALFIDKIVFNTVNGYPSLPLMEDVALSKKLRKQYSCNCLTEKVTTSSRRWETKGIFKTILLMWILRFFYFIGVNPNYLCKIYNGRNNTTCCLIFTKNPEPGKTKTRLIPAVGIKGAYKIHIKLLKHTLSIVPKIKNIDFLLNYTSNHNKKYLVNLAKKYRLPMQLQLGINLGERMNNAAEFNLKKYSQCIIIGTDCPELSKKYLLKAKHYLSSGYDAVIGPANDGGYVLIGLNTANKDVFSNIDWGESTVLASTIKNFERLNINYKKLATLHDIDTKEDLQYLKVIRNN